MIFTAWQQQFGTTMNSATMFRKLRNLFTGGTAGPQGSGFANGISNNVSQSLDQLIPVAATCALIDFPNYPNVGDSAIWLGERAYLQKRQANVLFVCDQESYTRDEMAAQLKEDSIILFQGGGNLGDLYPWHQKLREKVIEDFPEHKIVILPQSIYFQKSESLERAKRIFAAHSNLTLMLREQQSLTFAEQNFDVQTIHCPDVAFALGAQVSKSKPQVQVSCLLRKDAEAREKTMPATNTKVVADDWVVDDMPASDSSVTDGSVKDNIHDLRLRSYDRAASQRLERGCKFLAQGRVVVTDRLHGHIISILMGIPHVVLDNSYGKVRAVYDTWTKDSGLSFWAESRQEAVEQALTLAEKRWL